MNEKIALLNEEIENDDKEIEEMKEASWSCCLSNVGCSGIPIFLAFFACLLNEFVCLSFVASGKNIDEIAGMSLGVALFYIFTVTATIGIGDGVITLCSQAFGNQNHQLCGRYFNRGILISFTFSIPIAVIMLLVLPLLTSLGFDSAVISITQDFLLYQIPHILFFFQADVIRRYLQAIQIFYIQTVVYSINIALLFGTCYLIIIHFDYGVIGAAFCLNISSCVTFIMFYLFSVFSTKTQSSWIKFTKDAFQEWNEYFQIAIPAAAISFLLFSIEYITAIYIGFFSISQEAVHLSLMNLYNSLRAVHLGLSYAVYSLVGNAIGGNSYNECKKLFYSGFILWFACFVVMLPLLLALKSPLANLFFETQSEIDMMEEFLPWAMVKLLLNGIFWNLFSFYRGYGFQKKLTKWFCAILLLIGHPMAVFLCFPWAFGFEIYGVWVTLIAVEIFLNLYIVIQYLFIDWKGATKEIHLKLSQKKNHIE
jgi:multidrug resistance protein, MATE family